MEYRYFFITYEEAQKLLSILNWASKREDVDKGIRESAVKIREELRRVRDIDYGEMGGHQIVLSPKDAQLFEYILSLYDEGRR